MIGDKDGKTMIKLGDFGWAVNAKNGFAHEAYVAQERCKNSTEMPSTQFLCHAYC